MKKIAIATLIASIGISGLAVAEETTSNNDVKPVMPETIPLPAEHLTLDEIQSDLATIKSAYQSFLDENVENTVQSLIELSQEQQAYWGDIFVEKGWLDEVIFYGDEPQLVAWDIDPMRNYWVLPTVSDTVCQSTSYVQVVDMNVPEEETLAEMDENMDQTACFKLPADQFQSEVNIYIERM
jgi:hypothetical protein